MADHLSPKKRSWNMSRIQSKNSTPEKIVRTFLFKSGFRYRLYSKELPGKPDIVLPKLKTAIFVNGCFWHRHENCKRATTPKTNQEYWDNKFKRNIEKDIENISLLKSLGWAPIVIWECELSPGKRENTLQILLLRLSKANP